MRCLARIALRHTYLFSLLMGMLSFEFDFRRLRLRQTRRAAVYAAIANMFVLAVIPLIYYWNLRYNVETRAACLLHEMLFMLISLVRGISVFVSIIGSWLHRRELIAALREFLKLHRQYFRQQYVQNDRAVTFFERRAWRKYLAVTLTELLVCAIGLLSFQGLLTARLAVGLFAVSLVMVLLNITFMHYYLFMLQIHVHYRLIYDELAGIVATAKSIVVKRDERQRQAGRGLGAYITQCCQLADRLDELAIAERRLHDVCDRIHAMYSFQGICISSVFYLTSMSNIYFLYYLIKYDPVHLFRSYWGSALIFSASFSYYMDLYMSMFIMFDTSDLYRDCADLLRQYLPLPLLDSRLEMSFEAFTLQMQNRPIVFDMLGMFKFDKFTMFGIFGDLLQHILVLIQHDMKNKSAV